MNKILVLCIFIATFTFAHDIKVGILIGNSKPGIRKTEYTENFYKAVLLAKKKYSKLLKKKNINLVFKIYEMKEDPISNYYPMKQAIKDGMELVIGPSVSYYVPGVYYALEESKRPIPVISPYATSKLILDSKYMTSMKNMNLNFGIMLKDFLRKNFKKTKKLIVCATDIEISKYQCDTIPRAVKNDSIFIKIDKNLSNIEELKSIVKKNRIGLIITPNRIPITGIMIKELAKSGYKGLYIGSSSLGEVKAAGLLDVVGHDNFHAYVIREFSVHNLSKDKENVVIQQKLIEKWGKPRLTSLLFYDAMAMAIEEILKDRNNYQKNVIQNNTYKGLLSNRAQKKQEYKIIEIKNGNFNYIRSDNI